MCTKLRNPESTRTNLPDVLFSSRAVCALTGEINAFFGDFLIIFLGVCLALTLALALAEEVFVGVLLETDVFVISIFYNKIF